MRAALALSRRPVRMAAQPSPSPCCGPSATVPPSAPRARTAAAAAPTAEAGGAGSAAAVAAPGTGLSVLASVKEYYGTTLQTSKDLKTSACTAGGKPHPAIVEVLKKVPKAVTEKFYG